MIFFFLVGEIRIFGKFRFSKKIGTEIWAVFKIIICRNFNLRQCELKLKSLGFFLHFFTWLLYIVKIFYCFVSKFSIKTFRLVEFSTKNFKSSVFMNFEIHLLLRKISFTQRNKILIKTFSIFGFLSSFLKVKILVMFFKIISIFSIIF